jgi:hypothetical protein
MKIAGFAGGTASGSAVSLSADGARVSARIALARSKVDYDAVRIAAWQTFVNGAIEPTGAQGDWSVFVHRSLIIGALKLRLPEALSGAIGFRVEGPIETTWADRGNAGVEVTARLSGALTSTICPSDIHVNNIALSAVIDQNSATSPTGLLVDGSVTYDVSESDAALCGLLLGGPLGSLVLGSVGDSISLDLHGLGAGCSAHGDLGFTCTEVTHPARMSVGPLQIMTSGLAGVVGSPTGLALNGSVRAGGSSVLTMAGRSTPFTSVGTLASNARLDVTGTGRLCGVRFWADQGGDISLFTIAPPPFNLLPASYNVALPGSNLAAYSRNPFHVMATLFTGAGVQTYQLERVGGR